MMLAREQILKIPAMKKEKKTNTEIAKEFGVSLATIAYWTKRLRESGRKLDRAPHRGGRKKLVL